MIASLRRRIFSPINQPSKAQYRATHTLHHSQIDAKIVSKDDVQGIGISRIGQRHPWTRGVPSQQPFHIFSGQEQTWLPIEPDSARPADTGSNLTLFTVLSWNIDFMRGLPNERMKSALEHLHTHAKDDTDKVIMLCEMTEGSLEIIQSQDWIQKGFQITDLSSEFWEGKGYGTCMLIPKSMTIENVFRVHYEKTNMQRDALFADVILGGKKVRLCSTHLESLVAMPPKRPKQLGTAAKYLHEVHAGVLGGDLNAIESFDKTLHTENNLKDAYLESGQLEGAAAGMTWGQMAKTSSRRHFGLTRMDKLLYCGAIQSEGFETFGMDVQVKDNIDREYLMGEDLLKGWVTDHLGVKATFCLSS